MAVVRQLPHPPPEPDPVALQEQIRRVGIASRHFSWAMLLVGMLLGIVSWRLADSWLPGSPGELLPLAVGLLVMSTYHLASASAYRCVRRRQLRRQLAGLPTACRAQVLLPLVNERLGDARKLVIPLIREFRIPTELTPASARTGRCDELTAGEE